MPDPSGFALDCQLDKGLPATVDYMALRRAEDERACETLGAACAHLDLPEAPHRGYGSAAALFAGVRPDDDVREELEPRLRALLEADPPDLLFLPAGCGGHVDHRQLIAAAAALPGLPPTLHYRDTPYIIRDPGAAAAVPGELIAADVGTTLAAKLDACACYTTQLGFQFGGPGRMRRLLTALAAAEAAAGGRGGGRGAVRPRGERAGGALRSVGLGARLVATCVPHVSRLAGGTPAATIRSGGRNRVQAPPPASSSRITSHAGFFTPRAPSAGNVTRPR